MAVASEAVIVDVLRTPVGRGKPEGGWLAEMHPADLLAETLKGILERNGVDASEIDDVIAGCGMQVGEQSVNIARNAVLGAGFPEHVPGTTLDRQCGSSQQAAHFAAQGVMAGVYDAVIACGVEMMSVIPMGTSTLGRNPYGRKLADRYPEGLVHQGISAELIAARWDIERAQMDAFSAESHQRAAVATRAGNFENEILPVAVGGADGERMVSQDQGIRPDTTAEALAALKPAFYSERLASRFPEIKWTITAGNSSQISDGASAALIMSRQKAAALGLKPRARFVEFAVTGDDPILMLTGVIPATRKVLDRAGLGAGDIDVFEVNEAFAPVVLAWQREIGCNLDRVNVNGGAIALGHPIGASGTRLLATLVNVLEQRGGRYGLQTMCEGGGMANATIIERLEA